MVAAYASVQLEDTPAEMIMSPLSFLGKRAADLIPGDSGHDRKKVKKQEAPKEQVIDEGQVQMLLAIQRLAQQKQQQQEQLVLLHVLLQHQQEELQQLMLLQQQQEEQTCTYPLPVLSQYGAFQNLLHPPLHPPLHETVGRTLPALMPMEMATGTGKYFAQLAYTA
jgi:hypothetical protein